MVPAGLRRWLEGGRTGVKVCGVTRKDDALAAIDAGVDALGFNFYPGSKRFTTLEAIAPWLADLPADIGRVAVVVNADENLLRELQGSGLFHALQFHGDESPETCAKWGGSFYVRARALGGGDSLASALSDPAPCLLLDAHAPGVFGGTGKTIDWSLAARAVSDAKRPVVLSGGLNPGNVAEAIARVHPAAIDLASGVESSPGHKDATKMRALIRAVRGAE